MRGQASVVDLLEMQIKREVQDHSISGYMWIYLNMADFSLREM